MKKELTQDQMRALEETGFNISGASIHYTQSYHFINTGSGENQEVTTVDHRFNIHDLFELLPGVIEDKETGELGRFNLTHEEDYWDVWYEGCVSYQETELIDALYKLLSWAWINSYIENSDATYGGGLHSWGTSLDELTGRKKKAICHSCQKALSKKCAPGRCLCSLTGFDMTDSGILICESYNERTRDTTEDS